MSRRHGGEFERASVQCQSDVADHLQFYVTGGAMRQPDVQLKHHFDDRCRFEHLEMIGRYLQMFTRQYHLGN